jgi:dephospho-CoA kinase
MARDNLSAGAAQARIAAQWPLARKRALATRILDNRSTPEALAPQVSQALGSL